jgi:hypothetical protein
MVMRLTPQALAASGTVNKVSSNMAADISILNMNNMLK